jgi:hypothetical protein
LTAVTFRTVLPLTHVMVLFFALAFGDGVIFCVAAGVEVLDGVGDLFVAAAVTLSERVGLAGVAVTCVGALALALGIALGLAVAIGVGDT